MKGITLNRTAMYKLFVDDDRCGPQSKEWLFCHNYEEAIEMIKKDGIPIEISLDHDIWAGLVQGTGFVLWFKEYLDAGNLLPESFKYSIHSSNKDGAKIMQEIMEKITGKQPKHTGIWW